MKKQKYCDDLFSYPPYEKHFSYYCFTLLFMENHTLHYSLWKIIFYVPPYGEHINTLLLMVYYTLYFISTYDTLLLITHFIIFNVRRGCPLNHVVCVET